MKGARLAYFDALKLFAIYLVIWGHCINWYRLGHGEYDVIYRIIYSFHMPLFMMISGYFSYSSINLPFCSFLKKKFKHLIYPCISWGLILWIIVEPTHSFHYGHHQFSFGGLLEDFYWLSDFWFLKSCFLCYSLLYLCAHLIVNKKIWIPISLIISQGCSPFYFSFMYPCFLIGWLIKDNDNISKYIYKQTFPLLITFFIMLYFWDLNTWEKSHGLPSNILGKGITTIIETGGFRLFRLLIGIISSLSIFSLFHNLFKRNIPLHISTFCSKWGSYTLEIYILQSIIIERILHRYININISLSHPSVVLPIISFLILSLCVYITILMQRSQFLAHFLWWRT